MNVTMTAGQWETCRNRTDDLPQAIWDEITQAVDNSERWDTSITLDFPDEWAKAINATWEEEFA